MRSLSDFGFLLAPIALCVTLSSKDIARLLALSPRTVEMHRARLLRKLDVRSTNQLLALLV